MEVELDFTIAPPSPVGRLGSGAFAAPTNTITLDSDFISPETIASLKEKLLDNVGTGATAAAAETQQLSSSWTLCSFAPEDETEKSTTRTVQVTQPATAPTRSLHTTSSPEKAQQFHVSLVSLNACLWPWGLRQSIHDNQKLQRAEGIAELCKKYDIVCLQEVFTSAWDKKWPEVLKSEHLSYARADGREKWHILDTGLQVVTRYKILSSEYRPFESTGGLARFFKPFGYLHCIIEIPVTPDRSERFHVFNCHLHPDEGHYGPSTPLEIRFKQAQEISSQIPKDEPWIIAGDFNIHAHDPDGETLHQFFIHESDDGPKKASRFAPEKATIHNLVPFAVHRSDMLTQSVDHIYSCNPITEGALLEELHHLSDHLPVSVKISIT